MIAYYVFCLFVNEIYICLYTKFSKNLSDSAVLLRNLSRAQDENGSPGCLNCKYFSVTGRTSEFTPRYEYEIRRIYTIQGYSTDVCLCKGTKVVGTNLQHCTVPIGPVIQNGSCHVRGKRQTTSSYNCHINTCHSE